MKHSTISNAGDKLNTGFTDQHRVKSNITNVDVEHLGVRGMHLQVSNASARDHELNHTCGERYCHWFLTSVGNGLGTTGSV